MQMHYLTDSAALRQKQVNPITAASAQTDIRLPMFLNFTMEKRTLVRFSITYFYFSTLRRQKTQQRALKYTSN